MTVKTGQTWAGLFVTLDATGALAAGTPAGTLYVDGTSDAAEVTITGSNPYKYAVTLPTLTAGQRVDMYITATISTIATAAVVASEQADTSLVSDVKTDTAALMTAIEAISAGGATADEIWDEALSGHSSAGSAGKALSDILTDTGTDIPALIAALSAWQATNVTSSVASGSITDVRGSSWSIAIEDLTLDSNKQQFAIKRHAGDADAQALLLVDSATGLLTLNGVSTGLTAADASLVYSGTTLTLTVKAHITAQLPDGAWKYGIQYVTAAGLVEEPYGGTFTVSPDVVRAAS